MREGEGCRGCPPTWPAAVTVLLWPPGRPAGACPPGPSGPTPPRVGSRRSRLRFRSGTGAGRSLRPPSRHRPAGCLGRCSGRPRRRGSSGGGRGQCAIPAGQPGPLLGPPRTSAPPEFSPSPLATRPCRPSLWTTDTRGHRLRRVCTVLAPPPPSPGSTDLFLNSPSGWGPRAEGPEGISAGCQESSRLSYWTLPQSNPCHWTAHGGSAQPRRPHRERR